MNKIKQITNRQWILFGVSLSVGILFFLIRYEWIIFRAPLKTAHLVTNNHSIVKKNVTLYYWYQNSWHTETTELIWANQQTANIKTISISLLRLLEQEQLLHKPVTIEAVSCSLSGQECYISFDRNPLDKEWSTQQAWMFIESILKTIRENQIAIDKIYFLVRHQVIQDQRIDFSNAWPISGFINE